MNVCFRLLIQWLTPPALLLAAVVTISVAKMLSRYPTPDDRYRYKNRRRGLTVPMEKM